VNMKAAQIISHVTFQRLAMIPITAHAVPSTRFAGFLLNEERWNRDHSEV